MQDPTTEATFDTQCPRRRDGLIERELPEELILYDPDTDRAFLLNHVSAVIWDLCDGQNVRQQIGEEIASYFKVPVEMVMEDVKETIEQLRCDRLLVPG